MTDRVPGMPGRCTGLVTGEEVQKLQSGKPFAITLRRDDQPIKEGTPYSKAAVLPDALAKKLCPEVEDPAPKDAFAALQEKKADTVQRKSGAVIVANDCAHTPLKGLRLFGAESENTGDSISVTVAGKNLLDTSENAIKEVSFTASDGTVRKTYWGFELILPPGNYVMQAHINASGATSGYLYGIINDLNGNFVQGEFHPVYGGSLLTRRTTLSKTAKVILYDVSGTIESGRTKASAVLSFSRFDIQLELGATVTEFEPYKGQTIAVSTPNGLQRSGSVQDEIDFEKGVYIKRVGVESPEETKLSAETLERYAAVHTHTPTTVVFNSAGADMELTYYTPTTAVQMVHSPADSGKSFVIDEHGCATLTQNSVISFDSTIIDNFAWYYRKWANGIAECWGSFNEIGTLLATGDVSDVVRVDLSLPVFYDVDAEKRAMAFATFHTPIVEGEAFSSYLEFADVSDDKAHLTVRKPKNVEYVNGTIYTIGRLK